jgi:hypothetical protein
MTGTPWSDDVYDLVLLFCLSSVFSVGWTVRATICFSYCSRDLIVQHYESSNMQST